MAKRKAPIKDSWLENLDAVQQSLRDSMRKEMRNGPDWVALNRFALQLRAEASHCAEHGNTISADALIDLAKKVEALQQEVFRVGKQLEYM